MSFGAVEMTKTEERVRQYESLYYFKRDFFMCLGAVIKDGYDIRTDCI